MEVVEADTEICELELCMACWVWLVVGGVWVLWLVFGGEVVVRCSVVNGLSVEAQAVVWFGAVCLLRLWL